MWHDGWYHTGDLAVTAENGIALVFRRKGGKVSAVFYEGGCFGDRGKIFHIKPRKPSARSQHSTDIHAHIRKDIHRRAVLLPEQCRKQMLRAGRLFPCSPRTSARTVDYSAYGGGNGIPVHYRRLPPADKAYHTPKHLFLRNTAGFQDTCRCAARFRSKGQQQMFTAHIGMPQLSCLNECLVYDGICLAGKKLLIVHSVKHLLDRLISDTLSIMDCFFRINCHIKESAYFFGGWGAAAAISMKYSY